MKEHRLILHHYPVSPYSQKVRAILGYTNSTWNSVITSEAPPREKLLPLTGGYRKIPVAQLGADIFCDTRIIVREIASITNYELLREENLSEDAGALMKIAEEELFFPCGFCAASFALMWKSLKMFSVAEFIHFMKDRITMNRDASIQLPGRKESQKLVQDHLVSLEGLLTQDFLFGDKPGLADFAVYHGLWMIHVLGEKPLLRKFPKVLAWMERIENFGQGNELSFSADEALAVARENTPRVIEDSARENSNIGRTVLIGPKDYAKDVSEGVLVGVTAYSWIIEREHSEVGKVNVHFPQHGYGLGFVG